MSYAVKDKSIASGAPIECYKFVSEFKTWRYTSYHTSITLAGEVYSPLQIDRTAVELSTVLDSNGSVDIRIPSDHEIAKMFAYTYTPRDLKVTVYRGHEGDNFATDYKIEWAGYFIGASAEGKLCTIKTGSIFQAAISGMVSTVYYQKVCNHILFDERCNVSRAAFTETAVVTKVQNQLITIDVAPYADGDLAAGQITNTRTGEVQGIVNNEGLKVRAGYRFFDIIVGDTVELTLGCDHLRLGHCKNRFNNVPRYGGMDFIPEENPFTRLQLTNTTNTTVQARNTRLEEGRGSISVQSN